MDRGPAVSEAAATTAVVKDAAAGKLAQTLTRCQAALAAAEEGVQRAEVTLAAAEELLRRAHALQERFRKLQATGSQTA